MSNEHFVEHNGCRIAYQVAGQGPAILWIQGVGVHGEGWRPQIDAFQSEFTCISFDNRGMGRSQPSGVPVTLERMADDALAVLDAAGIRQAHIIGHSLGGMIAVQLALIAPERILSLSLLCTFANGRDAAPLTFRMLWYGLRSKIGTREMRRRGFLGLVVPPQMDADFVAMAEKMAPLFGHDLADSPPIVKEQLQAMRKANLTSSLGQLRNLKTLIVSATHDPIAPPQLGRILADAIPGSRFVEVPDASHGLPITHAEEVNQLLAAFLRSPSETSNALPPAV